MAGSGTSSAQLTATRMEGLDAPGSTGERLLPIGESLATLLPDGGIRRGAAMTVRGHGAVTLATALAVEASRHGGWTVAVGMADLGVSALAERGAALERWALVDPAAVSGARGGGHAAADVLGAVVGGFDLVLLGPGVRVGGTTARRLRARIREHGTSLICALGADAPEDVAASLQPEIRVAIERVLWTGIEDGHGRLLARRVEVTVGGRGAASRPRRLAMWLPSPEGGVACIESGRAATAGDGRDDVRRRKAG